MRILSISREFRIGSRVLDKRITDELDVDYHDSEKFYLSSRTFRYTYSRPTS